MYKVLLVDDEAIILSGIKFLINWEEHGFSITGTARNGQDAINKIREDPPDIVLCDINMPVMNGFDLLQIINDEFPSIVSIMLTNLQEFSLAIDALRCRSVDYLLKSQLEASSLIKSLTLAKEEHVKRTKLLRINVDDNYQKKISTEVLQKAFFQIIFQPPGNPFDEAAALFFDYNMLNNYRMLYIPLDFSGMPRSETFTKEDRLKLTAWERELADKLANNIFSGNYIILSTNQTDCLIMFLWNQKSEWDDKISIFSKKLLSASVNIVQAHTIIFSTECFKGKKALISCREKLLLLTEYYYLGGEECINQKPIYRPVFEPLGLTGIGSRFEAEINERNLTGCIHLLEKASSRISETMHQKSQAIWLCGELMRTASKVLHDGYFPDGIVFNEIDNLMTREQVIVWIEKFKNSLIEIMKPYSDIKSEPLEKAKQYVLDHIDSHIVLQEAAAYAYISSGYLSTLFKKTYGYSFVDFVNKTKVERACALISEGTYLINEIAGKLSFENAYYFTKVFKRHMGCTPSEYQKRQPDR